MPTVKIKNRETLFDAAVLQCGVMESAFDMALKNNLSLTDDLQSGLEIEIAPVVDADVVTNLFAQAARPASGIEKEINSLQGIDYWAIEKDFIVS